MMTRRRELKTTSTPSIAQSDYPESQVEVLVTSHEELVRTLTLPLKTQGL